MSDLYTLLGVNRTATSVEIKTAYRRLARQYHPDVNADPTAAGKFSAINEAYHTLIDPQRRNWYDRTGQLMGTNLTSRNQASVAAMRAARRAYYQARADRIVNEWLERERLETRARGKAVYTTVTLFVSTFIVAMFKPAIFETTNLFWRGALIVLFATGVWHLFSSLRQHFDYYTYRPSRSSSSRRKDSNKRFKRSVAWAFVLGGYLLSIGAGVIIGMLTEDISAQFFSHSAMADAVFSVLFYPPIAVLIVDTMYRINLRFDEL